MAQQLFGDQRQTQPSRTPGSQMLEALATLGADPMTVLTAAEREQLQEEGFFVLHDILTHDQCEEMKRRIHRQIVAEGDQKRPFSVGTETGALRLSNILNLDNGDGLFDVGVTHPKVLACMRLVLGDAFKLSAMNTRGAAPGGGAQGLHTDWGENPGAMCSPPQYQVCISVWMLDDFTAENGATRVLPGSHLTGRTASVLADPSAPQPGEVSVVGRQGSVAVLNSHLFHAGTHNSTDAPRMAFHGYYTRRHFPQQVDQQAALLPETYHRLRQTARGRAALAVLDVVQPADDALASL